MEKEFEKRLTQVRDISHFKKLVDIRLEKGYIVHETEIKEWMFSGIRYTGTVPSLFGPAVSGIELEDILSLPKDEALRFVHRLVKALSVLSTAHPEKLEITLDSVYFLDDGGVLFLPPEIFRKLRVMAPDEYKCWYPRINNPYAEDVRLRLSWSIAAIVYKILAGVYPFDGKTQEEIHTRIRHMKLTPPHFFLPELKPEISELFVKFFENRKTAYISLDEWANDLETWITGGVTRPLSGAEKQELESQRQKKTGRIHKQFSTRVFWEKNGRTIGIAITTTIIIAAVLAVFLVSVLKPRLTAGFSARKVVESFYESMNTLNTELMDNCLTGDASSADKMHVMMLYVTTREIYALSGKEYRIRADLWDKRGRPRVDAPNYIDGVANLTITAKADEPNPVFIAVYERWTREHDPDDPKNDFLIQLAFQVKDRLWLKKDGTDWVIYKIERLENRVIFKVN